MGKMQIIQELKDTCEVKMIVRNCNRILKRLSFKSYKDIGNVLELIVLLYIFDMRKEIVRVCSIMDDIEFTGNYTIFEKVEAARLITAKIMEEEGDIEGSKSIINKLIPYISKNVYNGKVHILKLHSEEAETAKVNGEKRLYIETKLLLLENMLYYSMLPDFPMGKKNLDKEIYILKEELRQLIK